MRAKPRLPTLPSRLIADREGSAAVEFALIFPVMFTLFIGSIEITNLLMANLKMTAATEAAADLLGQTRANTPNLAPADIDSFNTAAGLIMTPFATSGLKLAVAGLTYQNNGDPQVAWHHEENGAAAITTGSLDSVTIKGLGSGSDTLIMVKTTYSYTSPISFVLNKTYNFTDVAYSRPRYVTALTCTLC